ncbi:MAG TPA: T9SS type A sorting domain-containing protein [Ignavibacteriaceae bacterium]|nr:T9SS type A sorting domain-containing protein [Ignavibacteriaceae bacterium]
MKYIYYLVLFTTSVLTFGQTVDPEIRNSFLAQSITEFLQDKNINLGKPDDLFPGFPTSSDLSSKTDSVIYLPQRVEVLDSTKSKRYTYTYTNKGLLKTRIEENWENGSWVNFSKWELTYDNNDNDIFGLLQIWVNQWFDYLKITKTYNNNNLLNSLTEVYENSIWNNLNRYTFTYDANNNLLTSVFERSVNNIWSNYSKFTYSYDGRGNLLSELDHFWSAGEWKDKDRFSYTYDNFDNILSYTYEGADNQFILHFIERHSYGYIENTNLLTTDLWESWSGASWIPLRWTNNIYDSGRIVESVIFGFHNSVWRVSESSFYEYDLGGNLITLLNKVMVNDSLTNNLKYTYSYDEGHNIRTRMSEHWNTTVWWPDWWDNYNYDEYGNAVVGYSFIFKGTVWEPGDIPMKMNYNNMNNSIEYSAQLITIEYTPYTFTELEQMEFHPGNYFLSQNYPNPFNPSTLITYQLPKTSLVTLKVYDILGKEIITLVAEEQTEGSHSVNFNAQNLSTGVYFYQLKAGDFVSTKKLVLIK